MTDRPASPPLGVLFLGCGDAAAMHSRTLRRLGGVDLYYSSRDATRAESHCARFRGRRSFASYEQGLADPDIAVAFVATPTATHLDLALLALDAGKHVIIEKPAFMRSGDADIAAAAASKSGRRVFVAENYAYKPITRLIERRVIAGDLGDVRFVTINATKRQEAEGWRADPSLAGGGALFEGGIHWISFAASLGLGVESVHGFRAGSRAARAGERSSLVVFRYANGAVGTLAHSWELAAPFGGLRLSKVQGTGGAVTFESNGLFAVVTGRRRMLRVPAFSDPRGFRSMFEDFLYALASGQPSRYTLEDARRDLGFVEQASLSVTPGGGPRATPVRS